MPGLCPYLLSSLKDPSGPGRGGPWLREQSLAGGVGVGGVEDASALRNCSLQLLPKPRGGVLAVQQPLIKEFPVCFFNSIFSGI